MDWAIICGNYINAFSIITSLHAIGWKGKIITISEKGTPFVLTNLIKQGGESLELNLNEPDDIIGCLNQYIQQVDRKYIFFTDERFHETFTKVLDKDLLQKTKFFIGSSKFLDTILDRYKFYEFIKQNDIAPVPKTITSDLNPWDHFPEEFFIRIRRSWHGLRRIPGVKLIKNKSGFIDAHQEYSQLGVTTSDLCYQEVLSCDPLNNVSVSGWHEQGFNNYYTTRKIMMHPPQTGDGMVVELIEPPAVLLNYTSELLEKLCYAGPFELEFVIDNHTNEYKIIELNPRFWMQHGLIERITGNEIVRRYLGGDWINTEKKENPKLRYWVNSIHAIWCLLTSNNWSFLHYIRNPTTVVAPSWLLAVKWNTRKVALLARKRILNY